jgi:ferritin-like metal-binding protein YciE
MKESKLIQMQRRVEILGSALTNALKELEQLKVLAQGTLTAFQLHIGKDEWGKLVEELKDLEKRNVEQQLEKGD